MENGDFVCMYESHPNLYSNLSRGNGHPSIMRGITRPIVAVS